MIFSSFTISHGKNLRLLITGRARLFSVYRNQTRCKSISVHISLMNILTVLIRYTIGVNTRAMRNRNSIILVSKEVC